MTRVDLIDSARENRGETELIHVNKKVVGANLTRRSACLVGFAGALRLADAQPAHLKYQSRGRYNEGTRGAASTGVPLDLVAAMVDYRDPYTQLPPLFQALAYLPQRDAVYLTIREIDPEYYYWLDGAQPESGWQQDRVNRFQWPTQTVIRYLKDGDRPIALKDLGAVARLRNEEPSTPDTVAPVALFHSRAPSEATGYRFILRPAATVRLTFTLTADNSRTAIAKPQDFPELGANAPQSVVWKTDGWSDGWHQIAVSGYKLSDNTRVETRIRFYHRRMLAG